MYLARTFQSWRSGLTMFLLLRPLVEREAVGKGAQWVLRARGSKRRLLRWGRGAGSHGWQQGQRGRGLTDNSADQVCWWQPDKPTGMRQTQGQACHHSGSRSTGVVGMAAAQLQWSLREEQGWEGRLKTSSWAKEHQAFTRVSSSSFLQGYQIHCL